MKASHRAYARARERLLAARAAVPGPFVQDSGEELPPEIAAVQEAEEALRAAEEPIRSELDAAWEANRQAVGAAKKAIVAALREQAQVEVRCGSAARKRNPRHPVLNEDEIDQVEAARQAVVQARAVHAEAAEAFKAGVTAEQLGA